MYDMLTGPFNGSQWNGAQAGPMVFHHDWSRMAVQAANTTQPINVFNYRRGDIVPGALGPLVALRPANDLDTSLVAVNAVTKDCTLTHLGLSVEMRVRGVGAAVANDIALVLEADYRIAMSRFLYRFSWKSSSLVEFEGSPELAPSGRGQDWFSQRANEFQGNNGPPIWSNLRPLRRPLPCVKSGGNANTGAFIQGSWVPDPHGGVTFTTIMSFMSDIYGVLNESAD